MSHREHFLFKKTVILNDEHSEYQWLSFEKAKEVVSLPGNEEVLQSIENNFVKNWYN